MAYTHRRNRLWASESCTSVDMCTRTVGVVHIPHAVCARHLRYVYTHARFLRCLYTYGRSLTGTDDWRRSDSIVTFGDGVCTLTARPDGMPTRGDGQRRCVYKKVRQPTHLHVFMRHYKNRAHMISSIGFVHAGPCACPHACFTLACPIFYFNLNLFLLDIFILLLLYFSLCNTCTL